jgi:NADH dehydrogenase
MTIPKSSPAKIVIVGAGFGGLHAAERLAAHEGFEVTLISSEDSFTYYPQLYHTATGGVRRQSNIPLTEILKGSSVKFVQDTMSKLDPDAKTVSCASGASFSYDQLVLAIGGITNYFGIPGIQEFAFNIKTIAGAEGYKQHLHQQLVDNKKTEDDYVIIGGGPTGVELAASLVSYMKRITRMHGLADAKYRISVVEAMPRLLPRSPDAMGARVKTRLEALGINVMIGAVVKSQTADTLQLENESIATRTVVWTAGVANNPFFKDNELFTTVKGGKVQVDEYMQARPGIYVIGDNAATQYSGLAQTAIADADYVVKDILNVHENHSRSPYHQKAPTPVIPVGKHWGAAQLGNTSVYGMPAHLLRLAGDWIGYTDVAPFSVAVKSWMGEFSGDDMCSVCSSQKSVSTAASS